MSTRRRALFAIVSGLAVGLFGLLSRDGDVVALSLPPLLFGATLILSQAFQPPLRLRIFRTVAAPRIHEDEQTEISLTASNEGEGVALLSLRDDVPATIDVVEGETALAACLSPGESETRTYTVAARRGGHDQRCVRGASWARLGLAIQDLEFEMETRITSFPVYETLRDLEIHPRRVHAYAGSVRTRNSGSGLEILGCREYALGDDIRRINWRASARREDLIVNLFEQERMTDVNIIVDARAHLHMRVGDVRTFDLVVRAAASVASYFLRRGNRVGLMIYGDALNWTYPAAGRMQMERLLHALALARPSKRLAFGELRQIPTRLFATGSQLIVFSSLGSPEDAGVPAQLVARGYSVLLIHPNSSTLEHAEARNEPCAGLARRLLDLQQHTTLSLLTRVGVQVIDWDLAEPLHSTLHHARAMLKGGLR